MARIGCFSALMTGKKNKKCKGSTKLVDANKASGNGDLRVNPEEYVHTSIKKSSTAASTEDLLQLKATSETLSTKTAAGNEKGENIVRSEMAVEAVAYEGGDEHDDNVSMKRDYSELDLQALAADKNEFGSPDSNEANNDCLDNTPGKVEGMTPELIQSGHVSDPGMGQTTFWGSPVLKRSCSNIETKRSTKLLNQSSNFRSHDDLQNLSGNVTREVPNDSPLSVMTACSADKVMLKKRSSSQVLPSRSRKLWWKLFLWSHRNLHKPYSSKIQRIVSLNPSSDKKCGYCSDTLETPCNIELKMKRPVEEPETKGRPDLWPEYQWVAFSAESSCLDRVDAWVHSLEDCVTGDCDKDDGEATAPVCFAEIGECSYKNHSRDGKRAVEEIIQANTIIQSMNTISSVAHIAGMGLKVIPAISAFTSLRAVNLSGNLIVQISSGSLPKSLHTLDLSRNKITTIEGLRELTRLRVLNLSYNRISRIGHGLSNCTLIKELYLAGNKIGDVEGLHRLLKLTVLDLSFNKITTAKALGQLVANYSSLLALNLVGNPIQSNIGDEQLRKAVCGLLPHLTYLNKQPIKPQRVREVVTDSVAKAALGNGSWASRRRVGRRVGQSSSAASVKGRIVEVSSHRGAGSSAAYKRNRSNNKHSTRK